MAGRPRVLLVDDDDDVRHIVRLYLEGASDFEVVGEAVDGVDGVARGRDLQPDVVLLDIMMPRLNGHEAIPELLRVSPQSMIVMLSALAASSEERPALSSGAFAYVQKADITPEFGAHLHALLSRFRQALAGQTVWAPERPPR